MTKKSAKKVAARARQASQGGKYMTNMRAVEREDEAAENAILAAVIRFNTPTIEEVREAVAAANRQGVNPEAGWRITEGFPGGTVYEAIRATERERPDRAYPFLMPGIGAAMHDTRGPRSLACRCFECRLDDDACVGVLREAVRDRRSHFYAIETAALAGLLERLGTIDDVVGVPAELVRAEQDELLPALHNHVAIAELWPATNALKSWIARLADAVAERHPLGSTWWHVNRRLLELRDASRQEP